MSRKNQDVTDAELAVMRVLWEQGASLIREITEQIYPGNSDSDYATVKKLLARLEAKSFVVRHREKVANRFEATITREQLVGRRLEDLAEDLCGGSTTSLLMHLLEAKSINSVQEDELRSLVQTLKNKQLGQAEEGEL